MDSDSLPLNVSREMLQQNKVLKVIGKKMTRKALAMIKSMADADKKGDDDEEVSATPPICGATAQHRMRGRRASG